METMGDWGDVGPGLFLLGDGGLLESWRLMVSLFEFMASAPELAPMDKSPILLDKFSFTALEFIPP